MKNDKISGIVIFGATGDLCKRKLIPALYKLWQKGLIPENYIITGAARREPTTDQWKESLGEYPQEFLYQLDYVSCDLDNQKPYGTFLIIFMIQLIFFQFHLKDMRMQLSTLKKQVD